jgi:NAD+ diphosphatase
MDYAFAAAGLDRCVEQREDHDALARLGRDAAAGWLFVRADGAAPVAADGSLQLVPGDQLAELPAHWVFLGRQGDGHLFAAPWDREQPAVLTRWLDLRSAATTLDAGQAGLLAYARALCDWRQRHRFCGSCGARYVIQCGGHRLRCPDCDACSFPRTDPAVIVTVRDGERCLLGRQASWPAGRWSTLAGFVEPGETLEGTVIREVREESGVLVGDCRYLGSQPWPFPASLMLGFEATAIDPTITVGDELEDARWFDPDTLAAAVAGGKLLSPSRLSISRWLIERWYHEQTGQPLPSPP